MLNLFDPFVTSIVVGLAMAWLMCLCFHALARRPLTLSFAKGEGKALFSGLMLRAIAGPYLLIQGACCAMERREENFVWLFASTCGTLSWSLFNGALFTAIVAA